jgi:hypothetical protein
MITCGAEWSDCNFSRDSIFFSALMFKPQRWILVTPVKPKIQCHHSFIGVWGMQCKRRYSWAEGMFRSRGCHGGVEAFRLAQALKTPSQRYTVTQLKDLWTDLVEDG